MPLIECTLGSAEPTIAGTTYSFQRDEHGRFVAMVHSIEHMACLLAVVHYRVALDMTVPAAKPALNINWDAVSDPAPASLKPEAVTVVEVVEPTPATEPEPVAALEPEAEPASEVLAAQPGLTPAQAEEPAKKKSGRPSRAALGQ